MPSRTIRQPVEAVYVFCGPRYMCAYCNDFADTIDHAVPHHFVVSNKDLRQRYRFVKVSACWHCNLMAGGVVDETFIERRRRIAAKIRDKSQGLLSTAHWPDDELRMLGRNLRTYIKNTQKKAFGVRDRLIFLDNPIPPAGVPNELFIRIEDVYWSG